MAFATHSIDAITLHQNNVDLPCRRFPGQELIDSTSMNSWEDANVIRKVNEIGKRRLVFAGPWTSVCIVGQTLSALERGYEVYVIADACGDVSAEAHNRTTERMIQAGVRPMTSLQYLLELQRDWVRTETYELTSGFAQRPAGSYGLRVIYVKTLLRSR